MLSPGSAQCNSSFSVRIWGLFQRKSLLYLDFGSHSQINLWIISLTDSLWAMQSAQAVAKGLATIFLLGFNERVKWAHRSASYIIKNYSKPDSKRENLLHHRTKIRRSQGKAVPLKPLTTRLFCWTCLPYLAFPENLKQTQYICLLMQVSLHSR